MLLAELVHQDSTHYSEVTNADKLMCVAKKATLTNTVFARKRRKRIGVPPGTLATSEETGTSRSPVTLFEYNLETCNESMLSGEIDCTAIKDPAMNAWLNVDGIQDSQTLEHIGTEFIIHPLVLEDIQNPDHRPKVEDYESYLFLSMKMLTWNSESSTTSSEQISMILGKGYLLTFQERPGDAFELIRDRLRNGKGRVRRCGVDYLCYALIDTIVDNYYAVLEKLEGQFEELEEMVVYHDDVEALSTIHHLRSQSVMLRRSVWPLREMIHEILKGDQELIDESTEHFYRDVYDHVIEVADTVETFRDALNGLMDIHNSKQSRQLNSIMKVLTIISVIFIPPTFIVGVYGMNFHDMPELSLPWGYPAVWGIMVATVVGMIVYFRRKKWF